MGGSGIKKQHSGGGLLETLKMETVRTILTHTYPYPHEHSRHAVIAVAVGCLFFISSDNLHTLVQKLDNNIKWWSMYVCLLGFFYFFLSPFIGKTFTPSYSNFSRWYVGWILVAALYHLPSFQSMGVDMRMNRSLFLTIYVSSILFLLVFHVIFLGLWYVGLVARVAGKRPEILTIFQNCALGCNSSCSGSSDGISPIYSLWATFIGLYIANYVVERSTGWALTHPLSVEEYEKLKEKQMKPDFLDMVPWYSGTSADLFKTVFDLLVSVALFVGRFDMRMMQAAMSRVQDGAKQDDLLYDQFSEKDDLWFDFVADTGDGGNSSYSVARLLAQPSIRVRCSDSKLTATWEPAHYWGRPSSIIVLSLYMDL